MGWQWTEAIDVVPNGVFNLVPKVSEEKLIFNGLGGAFGLEKADEWLSLFQGAFCLANLPGGEGIGPCL